MSAQQTAAPKSRVASPLAHIIQRLKQSELQHQPFPHYYLDHVFPETYYRELLAHLPGGEIYQNLYKISSLKLSNFQYREQRDLSEDWESELPEPIKHFWQDFKRWFFSDALAQAVLHTFAQPMHKKYGTADQWPEICVEAQLIRHHAGYYLKPHSDLGSKLVVLLIYLPNNNSNAHLGTSLYRPNDPGFSCPDSIHHPFDQFENVATAPYRANSLLAFERSDRSFHGVEAHIEKDYQSTHRELIQYVIYDKSARQAQLQARREAALSEQTALSEQAALSEQTALSQHSALSGNKQA